MDASYGWRGRAETSKRALVGIVVEEADVSSLQLGASLTMNHEERKPSEDLFWQLDLSLCGQNRKQAFCRINLQNQIPQAAGQFQQKQMSRDVFHANPLLLHVRVECYCAVGYAVEPHAMIDTLGENRDNYNNSPPCQMFFCSEGLMFVHNLNRIQPQTHIALHT